MPDERGSGGAGAPLLRLRGLRGGYGGKPVLQGIDLDVGEGEITAVIGRNGTGKSTLMKSIIGLLPASAGDISFGDHDLARMPAHRRARLGLGYVPQGRDVFPRLTVEENLRVGFSLGGGKPADLDWVHGHLPILRERGRQQAGTLSGGQQQQLAIGRVLVGKPRLLLLDEPSEGIQPSIVHDIARLIVDVNRRTGLTVILVEQNIDMIRAMAQRCFVMEKGRIITELSRAMLDDREVVRRHLAV